MLIGRSHRLEDGKQAGVDVSERAPVTKKSRKSKLQRKSREWILQKKERQRQQGKEVRADSKYTGRKRRPKF